MYTRYLIYLVITFLLSQGSIEAQDSKGRKSQSKAIFDLRNTKRRQKNKLPKANMPKPKTTSIGLKSYMKN